jgi:hypothetical protein
MGECTRPRGARAFGRASPNSASGAPTCSGRCGIVPRSASHHHTRHLPGRVRCMDTAPRPGVRRGAKISLSGGTGAQRQRRRSRPKDGLGVSNDHDCLRSIGPHPALGSRAQVPCVFGGRKVGYAGSPWRARTTVALHVSGTIAGALTQAASGGSNPIWHGHVKQLRPPAAGRSGCWSPRIARSPLASIIAS